MPPPHGNLRGKAIGMFYAQRGKQRRKRHENENRTHVLMSQTQRSSIENTLHEVVTLRSASASDYSLPESFAGNVPDALPFTGIAKDQALDDSLKADFGGPPTFSDMGHLSFCFHNLP